MSEITFFTWLILSAAAAFIGDELTVHGELSERWFYWAAGRVLFAFAVSMLLVLTVALFAARRA